MRAVARGFAQKSLPLCPEHCGGMGANLACLDATMRAHRVRHGCDAPIPEGERSHYAIRCPRCSGDAAYGVPCAVCAETDTPGFLHMRRCPASQMTPEISEALRMLAWSKNGALPAPGGVGDQAASFLAFRDIFEAETNETDAEQRKEG